MSVSYDLYLKRNLFNKDFKNFRKQFTTDPRLCYSRLRPKLYSLPFLEGDSTDTIVEIQGLN